MRSEPPASGGQCPSCSTSNAPGNRFCQGCGAALAPTPTCRSCGATLSAGAKFCTTCGTAVAAQPPSAEAGAVVDGEWHRPPGELVRRVPADALRSAFARLLPGIDWGAFFGDSLAGKLADLVLSRSIRVPMGSIGVVVRDGVVVRVLPPGEQTTAGLLRELASGDVKAMAGAWAGSGRSALYLVDRRPIPVSFATEVAAGAGLQTLQATAMITVGADKDALGAFLNEVVADRHALTSEDLYARFRGEVERVVTDALRARPGDPAAAERVAREALRAQHGRLGVRFELVLAPRHTVHRLDLRLDELLTKDAARIELDLVLSVQGQAPKVPADALRGAAERHLRGRSWPEVATGEGFALLEAALSEAADEALRAQGARLLAVDLVDARSAGEAWALGARAAMAKARSEAEVGREWLGVRETERATEELTLAAALADQKVRRDAAFRAREAALEDARRTASVEEGERELSRRRAEGEHADAMSADARLRERERQQVEHRREQLSKERRGEADDAAYVERTRREQRLAELSAMADLEGKIAEREHREKLETMARLEGKSEAQMIAMQAATLASAEHGGAFAEALAKLADGEAARRERELAQARLDAKDERVMSLVEKVVGVTREAYRDQADATRDMAKTAVESHAKVAAGRAAHSCPRCGEGLAADARFCGACGSGIV